MKLPGKFTACLLIVMLTACDSGQKDSSDTKQLPSFATQKRNNYIITQGDMRLEIMANFAARISSFKIAGEEMLVTPANINTKGWGNVFWTSPQSEWNWPPLETLDSAPYEASVVGDRLVFTSSVDKKTGYQIVKSYGLNTAKKCLSIRYSIYNHSTVEKNVAGWELTRLKPSGIAFFPQGYTNITSGMFYPLPVEHIEEITWVTYDPGMIRDNHHKLISDGKEGWLAYTNKQRLLIKEFVDVPVELMVAGEGEIEMFVDDAKFSMEIDEQSAVTRLAPGEHTEWEVLWHTRKLPDNIKAVNGNPDLVNYVRTVLSGGN